MIETFFNTIEAYVIIIAPSLMAILGIVLSVIRTVKSASNIDSNVNKIVDEALLKFNEFSESNDIIELRLLVGDVLKENKELKQALAKNTEALTRIREKHPELFEEGSSNEKNA